VIPDSHPPPFVREMSSPTLRLREAGCGGRFAPAPETWPPGNAEIYRGFLRWLDPDGVPATRARIVLVAVRHLLAVGLSTSSEHSPERRLKTPHALSCALPPPGYRNASRLTQNRSQRIQETTLSRSRRFVPWTALPGVAGGREEARFLPFSEPVAVPAPRSLSSLAHVPRAAPSEGPDRTPRRLRQEKFLRMKRHLAPPAVEDQVARLSYTTVCGLP
jgi:hypothetical protein